MNNLLQHILTLNFNIVCNKNEVTIFCYFAERVKMKWTVILFKNQCEHLKIVSMSTTSHGTHIISMSFYAQRRMFWLTYYYFKAQSIKIWSEISSKGPLLYDVADNFFHAKVRAISQECVTLGYRCWAHESN